MEPTKNNSVFDPRRDNWWGWIVLILLVAVIGFATYSLVSGKSLTVIEVVITALVLKLNTMLDFRYGSSKSSQEKTEILTKPTNNA